MEHQQPSEECDDGIQTSAEELLFNAFSVVLQSGHLTRAFSLHGVAHANPWKALRLTCHGLRSLVSSHVHALTIELDTKAEALAASGLLGKRLTELTLCVNEKSGHGSGWVEVTDLILAKCAPHLRELYITTYYQTYEPTIEQGVCQALARGSWPVLTALYLRPDYQDPDNACCCYPLILGEQGAARFPKLVELSLLVDSERAANLAATSWCLPQLRILHLWDRTAWNMGVGHDLILQRTARLKRLTLNRHDGLMFLMKAPLPELTALTLSDCMRARDDDDDLDDRPSDEQSLAPIFKRPWPELRALELNLSSHHELDAFPPKVAGASATALFPFLTALKLNNIYIDWEAFRQLNFIKLRMLDLTINSFNRRIAEELVATLDLLPNLRVLKLCLMCECIHGDDDACPMLQLLASQCMSRLTALDVSPVHLGPDDLHFLQGIATRCSRLRLLQFGFLARRACTSTFKVCAAPLLIGCRAMGALPLLKMMAIFGVDDGDMQALHRAWPDVHCGRHRFWLKPIHEPLGYRYSADYIDCTEYAYMD